MATVGPVNGTDVRFHMGTQTLVIAYATSCSIAISHSPRSTTNSTSGAYSTKMAGTIDWEMSVDSLMSMDGTFAGTGPLTLLTV